MFFTSKVLNLLIRPIILLIDISVSKIIGRFINELKQILEIKCVQDLFVFFKKRLYKK